MKHIRFKKKLLLNKKTIANLEIKELEVVYGGITRTCERSCLCPTQTKILPCLEC
jgi:hypothetical protein